LKHYKPTLVAKLSIMANRLTMPIKVIIELIVVIKPTIYLQSQISDFIHINCSNLESSSRLIIMANIIRTEFKMALISIPVAIVVIQSIVDTMTSIVMVLHM
jgi:hypothetical protein